MQIFVYFMLKNGLISTGIFLQVPITSKALRLDAKLPQKNLNPKQPNFLMRKYTKFCIIRHYHVLTPNCHKKI